MNIHTSIQNAFLPTLREVVTFCVGQDLHRVAAFREWVADRQVTVWSLVGCYRGVIELSFAMGSADFANVTQWTVAEESTLHLGLPHRTGGRTATLKYADGRTEELGAFVTCPRGVALSNDSWTFDPVTGRHFVCEVEAGI